MARLKLNNASYSGWGTAQTMASDGTTTGDNTTSGMDRFTGADANKWTHVPSTDLSAKARAAGALGYIQSTENSQSRFWLQGSTTLSSGDERWWRYQLRLVRTSSSLASSGNQALFLASSTRNVQFSYTFHADTSAANTPAWGVYRTQTLATVTAEDRVTYTGSSDGSNLIVKNMIAFGEWVDVWIHVKCHATTGVAEIYLNGELASWVYGDTTTGTPFTSQFFAFQAPVTAGVVAQITGPIESWDATTSQPTIRPNYSLDAAGAIDRHRTYKPLTAAGATTSLPSSASAPASNGCHIYKSAGSPAGSTDYGSSGQTPLRHRITGDGSTTQVKSIDDVGTPFYNAFGWTNVVLSDLMVPDGGGASLVLKDSGGTTIFTLAVNGTSNAITYNATELGSGLWTVTQRMTFIVHLHRSGQAAISMFRHPTAGNATDSAYAVRTAWSFALANWTPAATFGQWTLTLTDAACEAGYIDFCDWAVLCCLDSMEAQEASAASPHIMTTDHVARALPYAEERTTIPGGYYPMKEYGLPRRPIVCPIGYPGITRTMWQTNVGQYLTNTYGCLFINIDGGSINDIAAIGSGADTTALGESTVDGMMANLKSMCDVLLPNRNRIWFASMIDRPYNDGSAYGTNSRTAIWRFNERAMRYLATRDYYGLVRISNPYSDLFEKRRSLFAATNVYWQDKTHTSGTAASASNNYTGDRVVARSMVETERPGRPLRSRARMATVRHGRRMMATHLAPY